MKQFRVAAGIALGVVLVIIAAVYFVKPANALPGFFPGHDATLTRTHFKHGVAALLLGLACFAFAWFQSGKKSTKQEKNG